MKGLLLKDFYMAKKYCKSYLLIAVVFIGLSFANADNTFFVFYPCLLCGMIPVNLLSYDERSRWLQYSRTLPYTKAQLVSSKYLIGLFAQLSMLLIIGISQGIKMKIAGVFLLHEYVFLMLMVLVMSTITSSICLPFLFKLGVEKGRIAYYVMIGFICGGSVIAASLLRTNIAATIDLTRLPLLLLLIGAGGYALSWYLSIWFFEKREI